MKAFALLCLILSAPSVLCAQTLVTVGKTTITVDEFNRRIKEARKQGLNPPSREEFLEDMVQLEVIVQEAEKLKMQDDPVVRDQYRSILYNHYVVKQLGDRMEKLKVSEKDLKEYYKKQPELRLAHIFINSRPEAKKKAVDVLTETKAGKRSFEDLAKTYSDDPATKDAGGDLGFQNRMTLPTALYDAALGMKSGEVQGPIETPSGFYIIKLLERRKFDMADKHLLRAAALSERREKIFKEFFDKTKKNYKVEINQEALKSAIN
jgi:parvulin-like peptidyl-prolyl isomerase